MTDSTERQQGSNTNHVAIVLVLGASLMIWKELITIHGRTIAKRK
jgi:hypothetical protein